MLCPHGCELAELYTDGIYAQPYHVLGRWTKPEPKEMEEMQTMTLHEQMSPPIQQKSEVSHALTLKKALRSHALTIRVRVDGLFICHYTCCCIIYLSTQNTGLERVTGSIHVTIKCMHYYCYQSCKNKMQFNLQKATGA